MYELKGPWAFNFSDERTNDFVLRVLMFMDLEGIAAAEFPLSKEGEKYALKISLEPEALEK